MEFNEIADWVGTPVQTNPPDQRTEFARAIDKFAPGFSQYLPTTNQAGDWVDSIAKAAAALQMTRAQRELLQIQMDRARAGLPPLDSSQYGLGATVGISRDTLVTVGLVGLGLIAAWTVLRRR